MCWVSSISSPTSRNMSFRLSGPRSRVSGRMTEPPVAHSKHRLRDTDSSVSPDIFPSLPPPVCLSACLPSADAPRTHSGARSWIRFIWKVEGGLLLNRAEVHISVSDVLKSGGFLFKQLFLKKKKNVQKQQMLTYDFTEKTPNLFSC